MSESTTIMIPQATGNPSTFTGDHPEMFRKEKKEEEVTRWKRCFYQLNIMKKKKKKIAQIGVGREDFGFILKCAGIAVGFILHRAEHTETAKFFSPGGSLLPPNADRKSKRNRFFLHHLPISPSGKHAGLVQACRHNVYKSMKRVN